MNDNRHLPIVDGNGLAGLEQPPRPLRGPASRHRALRRAVKRIADAAMRCADTAAAGNEALATLRAELVYRFDLLRSRQRQPALIDPEPLPPPPAP